MEALGPARALNTEAGVLCASQQKMGSSAERAVGTPGLARLRPNEILYLAGCLVLVAVVRLGLALLSYTTVRRLVPRHQSRSVGSPHANHELLRRASWAVAKAGRMIPYATCLTQALAVEFLLGCHGQQAEVHIGVAKGDDGRLCAHAWVTSCGRVVIGGPLAQLEHYTRLTRDA